MDPMSFELVRSIILFMPIFVLSITFHEYAHAWAADRLGDATARYMGRLTLDPMPHASLFGTFIFPIMSLITNAPLFGWANPVPVDMRNFPKNPRRSMAIVAAAGPASNLILGILFTAALAVVLKFAPISGPIGRGTPGVAGAALEMFSMAIQLNLFLAFFNLIPIPPLDGGRIIQGFVNQNQADAIDRFAGQGQIILLLLFLFGFLKIIAVPVYAFMGILFHLFGITG